MSYGTVSRDSNHQEAFMLHRSGRLTAMAGLVIMLTILAATTAALGQTGKPEYKPEVEEVARVIFLEILSPY
jgi:hypothetical protein